MILTNVPIEEIKKHEKITRKRKYIMSFTMPFLSRYIFFQDGKCKNRNTKACNRVVSRPHIEIHYTLKDDSGKMTDVTIREIIQYGKHVESARKRILGL